MIIVTTVSGVEREVACYFTDGDERFMRYSLYACLLKGSKVEEQCVKMCVARHNGPPIVVFPNSFSGDAL